MSPVAPAIRAQSPEPLADARARGSSYRRRRREDAGVAQIPVKELDRSSTAWPMVPSESTACEGDPAASVDDVEELLILDAAEGLEQGEMTQVEWR
jgi:hypothetical protein